MKKAFTLIELLLVILIIGILTAAALPQYQKTVEKARATEAITNVNAWYHAAQRYYLANSAWPGTTTSLQKDLDIVLLTPKDFWQWTYLQNDLIYVGYQHKTKGYMIFRVLKGQYQTSGLGCLGLEKSGEKICKSLCGELRTIFSLKGCFFK